MNEKKIILLTIKILIIITPLLSFGEVSALMTGTLLSQSESYTPVWVKLLKDIGFAIISILSLSLVVRKQKINQFYLISLPLLTLIIISFIYSYNNTPLIILVAGLRWAFPFFILFFLLKKINRYEITKISCIMSFLLVLSVSLQIYQLFTLNHWFGTNQLGLSVRNPGFFLIPNTSAFFGCLCCYYILFFSNFSNKIRFLLVFLSIISVLLNTSLTGIVGLLVVFYFKLIDINLTKIKTKASLFMYFIISIFIGSFIYFLEPLKLLENYFTQTGRGRGYIQTSGGGRVDIFFQALNDSGLISDDFGVGTNTGVLFSDSQLAQISDSTYASVVINTGLVGLVLVIILVLLWIAFVVFKSPSVDALCFTFLYLVFSLTTIVFETFPMNLLLGVMVAYYLSPSDKYYPYKIKSEQKKLNKL